MAKKSAGLLIYRMQNKTPQVLLGHPGGPFWSRRDTGAWSIPKGEFNDDEDPLNAAFRETEEEIGVKISGTVKLLTPVKLKSGKIIYAWAIEFNFNTNDFKSNLFEMEWPQGSGIKVSFPELDRVDWFYFEDAKVKINAGQIPFIEQLEKFL